MSVRTHYKLIGMAGAAALTVGALASPAMAVSKNFNYDCPAFAGLGANSAVNVDLDPGTIPATLVAGQKVKNAGATMTVHLDQTQTAVAQAVGTSVSGTMVAPGASNTFPFNLTFPATPIPATPGATMQVVGTGSATIRPLKAGTWNVKAGDMTATLAVTGGAQPLTVPFACTAPTGAGTVSYGTIAVSKDKTTTTEKASYNAKKDVAKGTATVKSHFGLKATGKVKFTLKKGSTTLKTLKGKINNKGKATASFKKISKKGKYSITASYGGNGSLKGSSDKAKFTVK